MTNHKRKNNSNRKRIITASIAVLMITQAITINTVTVLANYQQEAYQSTSQQDTAGIYIEKNGVKTEFSDLATAITAAENNDVITLKQDVVTVSPISLYTNKMVTIQVEGNVTFRRVKNQDLPIITVRNQGKLVLTTKDKNSSLTIDGENYGLYASLITVEENSYLQIEDGVKITRASLPRSNNGVLMNNGHVVMNGGEISNSHGSKNTGVNNKSGAIFELRGGKIYGNTSSNSSPGVYNEGTFKMSGGEISQNTTNFSDGGFTNAKGGVFEFCGGVIKNNQSNNGNGVTLNAGSSMIMSKNAQILSNNNILIKEGAVLDIKGNLTGHSNENPLGLLVHDVKTDRDIVRFDSEENAKNGIKYINAMYAENENKFALTNKKSDPKILTKFYNDHQQVFDLIENPYKDNLGLEFKDEINSEQKVQQIRDTIEKTSDQIGSSTINYYLEKLDYMQNQIEYVEKNKSELENSIIVTSQLGDPNEDQIRTGQSFSFDNIDITGYYIKPGAKRKINVYVDAQNPEKIQLAYRKAGEIDGNNYTELNLSTIGNLKNGINEITIDLTNTTAGHMLYIKNNSTDNPAKVRIEAVDANEQGNQVIVGTQLGKHPYYIHDTEHPEKFWDFVKELSLYSQKLNNDKAGDMTILQMGDDGRSQITIRAKLLNDIYRKENLNTMEKSVDYITKSNEAIQGRLEAFWQYEGYDEDETGVNAISKMRVHTIFTNDISSPSTLYAFNYYYHMPESTVESFLNGSNVYSWGMTHEYGHMLDNKHISVPEETNNLYSILGARNQGYTKYLQTGNKDAITEFQHVNIKEISIPRHDQFLKDRAKDSNAVGGFNGGNGFYKVMTWYLGSKYYDNWDYSNYDFNSSPYTKELSEQVSKYGAYGTALRILREDASKVNQITNNKYERIMVAFTMSTGFNFSQYMEAMGQNNISQNVKDFCAQYPDMPRKVQYYSLDAEAKELVGERTYDENVTPNIEVIKNNDGSYTINASMKTKEQQDATIAYELYRDGKLVDFSRDGKFTDKPQNTYASYQVIAYDYRLNQSNCAKPEGIDVFTEVFYRGEEVRLTPGEYPVIDFSNIKDNEITSVKVPKGYQVELYTEPNFKGKKLILRDFGTSKIILGMDNDISSIKVIKK